jgi:hypothetical protein
MIVMVTDVQNNEPDFLLGCLGCVANFQIKLRVLSSRRDYATSSRN